NTARFSGTKNVSTARHSFNRQAVLTNAAMKVNTVKPIVNRVRPTTVFHKTHSPFSKPFNKTTALRTNFSKQKVNTAKLNAVSAIGGKRETADYPHRALQNKGIVDSGCSRHMTVDVLLSMGFRESLRRALDGTEALMLPKFFIHWLATVSTDSAELVSMGKVSTAIKTLKKNTAKGTKCKLKRFP
ncbi:hypothetical protein Tco_0096263, partial [Tanacetum coccineum]